MFESRITPASLAGITVGMNIEVDGFVAADGSIHATRVEPNAVSTDNEVTGNVASLDTTLKTFKIGTLIVNYATATLKDFLTTGPANGDLVEVKGTALNTTGQLVAVVVARKHFDDNTLRDANDVEFEGLVTRFASATDFDVNSKAVTTTSTTRFEGGTAGSLALNAKVEVEGKLNSTGVLVADKISFHQEADVRVDGNIESIDTTAGTLKVLGITIKASVTTTFDDRSSMHDHFIALSKLAVGDHVQVRGVVDATIENQLNATRLERESGSATTVELRGSVATLAQPGFTILGINVATTTATTFKGITATALFASTTHPLVDVRGTWDGATLTAQSVQIQMEEEMHD
jgi:cytoskeletal protein CcmA (bactofilin family)